MVLVQHGTTEGGPVTRSGNKLDEAIQSLIMIGGVGAWVAEENAALDAMHHAVIALA